MNGVIPFVLNKGNGSGSSSGDAKLEEKITSNVTVGNATSGTVFPQNMTFTEYVKKVHIKDIASTITLTTTVAGGLFEKGTTQTVTKLSVSITKNSAKSIDSIDWYKGSSLIQSTTCDTNTTYTLSVNDSITTDTTYKVILHYKNGSNVSSTTNSEVKFEFVGATYVGSLGDIPTSTTVTTLTKLIKKKGNSNNTVNANNQYVVFAYPSSFGNLTSILDGNGFENLTDFTKITATINGLNYNIYYTNTKKTLTNFTYNFKY